MRSQCTPIFIYMVDNKMANKLSNRGNVVGTVHSAASLKAALRIEAGTLDFLEIRVDSFIGREEELLRQLPKMKLPLIVTVRHPLEGGAHGLSAAKRRECYKKFLPHAALVDIELRSAKSLDDVVACAQEKNKGIILSYHNFRKTPSLDELRSLASAARKAGADIFKAAVTVSTPADLAVLLSFQAGQKMRLSLMGMGRYGKISRLLFAQAGSVLNYGFLGSAQVDGQWPAVLLKKRIGESLVSGG
jgi:3-dehydroquinate dehydratase I